MITVRSRRTASTQATYCEFANDVLRVRRRRTKTFFEFFWWFARNLLSLQSNSKCKDTSLLFNWAVNDETVMTEQEIFLEKAKDGYTICFAEQCPLKAQCLRFLVGQQMPDTKSTYYCVNPHYQDVATNHCSLFRNSKKVKFAKGMTHIFNSDMPRKIEPFVRQRLIGKYCRTYYFEFRRGARLIPPTMQEEVRNLFREAGWNDEVHFDGYVEDYDW